MKFLIIFAIFFAALSSNTQAQYQRYPYYRPAPRNYNPYGYRPIPYNYYWHAPYQRIYRHPVAYTGNQYYQYFVSNGWGQYLYGYWFMYRAQFSNGYHVHNNYPYFAFNGYLHRYSSQDLCSYQLVDKAYNRVVQNWWGTRCDIAYNNCASIRDGYNYRAQNYQFFCAETFRNRY